MKSAWLVAGAVAMLVIIGVVMSQERPRVESPTAQTQQSQDATAPARPQDDQAIREASQAFAKAFEQGDAKAVTAFFTDAAEYHDEGSDPVRGRKALADAYEKFFAQRKALKATSETNTIRFLGADTAVEEGTFTVGTKNSPPITSRFSALYVRENGSWRIALLKEWGDDAAAAPSLEDLAWLIGTWESEGDELTARTVYEWAENKAFIRARFTIASKKDGEQPNSGIQVIGVDPAVGYIRAWLFASDGGIGESTWAWDGHRWMIESVGTLADGTATTALNFLSRTDDDEFTWRSVQRTLAGEPQADVGPVKVKRVRGAEKAPRDSTP